MGQGNRSGPIASLVVGVLLAVSGCAWGQTSTPPSAGSTVAASSAPYAMASPAAGSSIAWERVDLPARSPVSVAAFGGGFVIADNEASPGHGFIWLSPDGEDWKPIGQDGPTFEGATVGDIVATSVGLLAVGHSRTVTTCEAGKVECTPTPAIVMWTSADGTTWQRLAPNPAFDGVLLADGPWSGEAGVVFGGFRYTAGMAHWLSLDGGRTWVAMTEPPGLTSGAFAWHRGHWIANDGFHAAYSVDGSAWTRAQVPSGDNSGPELVVAERGVLMHSHDHPLWVTSAGDTWTVVATSAAPIDFWGTRPIFVGDGRRIFALGGDRWGTVFTWASSDAVTWTTLPESGNPPPIIGDGESSWPLAVAAGTRILVIVGGREYLGTMRG